MVGGTRVEIGDSEFDFNDDNQKVFQEITKNLKKDLHGEGMKIIIHLTLSINGLDKKSH